MKDKNNSSNQKYKMGFYVLLALFVVGALVFALDFFGDSRFNEGVIAGQSNAAFFIANSAAASGFVTIAVDNTTNLTLVPAQALQVAQSQLVEGMLGAIQQNGFVAVGTEENPIFLAPVQIDPSQLEQLQQAQQVEEESASEEEQN